MSIDEIESLFESDVYYPFPYGVESVEKCFIETETKLRAFVNEVMTTKYGVNWMGDSSIGFSEKDILDMENRRTQEKQVNPHGFSDQLIDYSYLADLGKVISWDSNWQLFKNYFPERKKTIILFDMLIPLRNPIIHGRLVSIQKKHLCLGICGEFLKVVSNWQLAFGRMPQSYQFDFAFDVPKASGSENEAKAQAQQWISCILQKVTTAHNGSYEKTGDAVGEKYDIKISKGRLGLECLNTIREQNMNPICHRCYVILKSQSIKAIDEVLQQCPRPYWCLRLQFGERLPRASIIANADAAGRRNNGSGSFNIDSFDDTRIWCHVNEYSMELTYDSNLPNVGFLEAHNMFSLDKILGILYNRWNAASIREVIKEAHSGSKLKLEHT